MEKSSTEIANEIALKEQELAKVMEEEQKVEQEILHLQYDIIEKQHKKKALEISNSKSKYLVRKVNVELRILKGNFWSARNSGL